jgi:hypothetical protein
MVLRSVQPYRMGVALESSELPQVRKHVLAMVRAVLLPA